MTFQRISSAAILAGAVLTQGCLSRGELYQRPARTEAGSAWCQAESNGTPVVVGSDVSGDPAAPEPASGYRVGKRAVTSRMYMVSTANPHASAAACRVLAAGGSAADAGIAALTVLGLAEPQSSGIGGGAFAVYYDAASGRIVSYDGREPAPAAATENYLRWIDDATNRTPPVPNYRESGRSIGMPGAVRMLARLHEDFGKRSWASDFAPAIELATKGFPVSGRLANAINEDKAALIKDANAAALYFRADGSPKKLGERFTNKPYAKTLELIAQGGEDAFYKGPLAAAIVAEVQRARRADGSEVTAGKMTLQDLASYQAKRRAPEVCSSYRDYVICGMPPPSAGSIAVSATMGILESFDLKQYAPRRTGTDAFVVRPEAIHLVSEAERLAYADRDRYVSDPDFIPLPPGGAAAMLDKDYLRERAKLISLTQSMGTAKAGTFDAKTRAALAVPENGTSHVSIVDNYGNALAMTATINSSFGSFRVVNGFVLNNVVGGAPVNPRNAEGVPLANNVGPLKRARSSMSPTLVFIKKADGSRGDLVMVTGSPGSGAIPQYVIKTLVAALDWGLDAQEATSLANFGAENSATTNLGGEHPTVNLKEGDKSAAAVQWLQAAGHRVSRSAQTSGVSTIIVRGHGANKRLEGGADPRREGLVLGD